MQLFGNKKEKAAAKHEQRKIEVRGTLAFNTADIAEIVRKEREAKQNGKPTT